MAKGWQSRLNAKKYDEFSKRYSTYRRTSRFLVELSGIKEGMTVVDLACGTGATTREILRKLGGSGKVICLDISKEMILIAKRRISQNNVSFIVSPAEDIGKVVKDRVDLVVCNSAFWQTKADKTLRGIRKILKKDGRVVFNLGSNVTSVLETLCNIAAERKEGRPFKRMPKNERLMRSISKSGFEIKKSATLFISNKAEEEKDFLKIPVMTERALPKINYKRRCELVDEAFRRTKYRRFRNKWVCYVLKKR